MSAREISILHRSEKRPFAVDFGENTAGVTTGPLPPGDTVASATVTIGASAMPSGASSPTIGSVTVNATTEYVNDRSCSAGEVVLFPITMGSSQAYGEYVFTVTATTAAGYILIDTIKVIVEPL